MICSTNPTAIAILNFSDGDVEAWIPWPKAGQWEEQISKADDPQPPVLVPNDGQWIPPVRVSSNYGAVYLHR